MKKKPIMKFLIEFHNRLYCLIGEIYDYNSLSMLDELR